MKVQDRTNARHKVLGRISTATRGGIKGTVEAVGLFTPGIELS